MFKFFKSTKQDQPSKSRRLFFKGAATAGVALASIGGMAAALRNGKTKIDYQAAYDKDVIPGDKILQQNGFEEIGITLDTGYKKVIDLFSGGFDTAINITHDFLVLIQLKQ